MKIPSTAWRLSDNTRKACATVGLLFCLVALWMEVRPPTRRTVEINQSPPSPTRTERIVDAPSENTTAHVAMFIAGAALILFGANGVRFFSLKTSFGEFGSDAPGEPADVDVRQATTVAFDATAPSIEKFLNLSSWAGLKLLKACSEAAKKQRPLNLRALGRVGREEVSYDYLYGYLIASISAGAVGGYADAAMGILMNATVHPIVTEKIDAYITGNIPVIPSQSAWKQDDLARLNAFLSTI